MVAPIQRCQEICGKESDLTIEMYAWACEDHEIPKRWSHQAREHINMRHFDLARSYGVSVAAIHIEQSRNPFDQSLL
jgi:hypothetical protein